MYRQIHLITRIETTIAQNLFWVFIQTTLFFYRLWIVDGKTDDPMSSVQHRSNIKVRFRRFLKIPIVHRCSSTPCTGRHFIALTRGLTCARTYRIYLQSMALFSRSVFCLTEMRIVIKFPLSWWKYEITQRNCTRSHKANHLQIYPCNTTKWLQRSAKEKLRWSF